MLSPFLAERFIVDHSGEFPPTEAPQGGLVQILHPFVGSVQQYFNEIADPDRYRPDHCPQCDAHRPLSAHGFYSRTVVDVEYDGVIRVRRYLCRCCKRTVSLLPEFTLPYLRFGIALIALFLIARLLLGRTLGAAAVAATLPDMPYQRGQFWVHRFRQQAERLCAGLTALTPPGPAPSFVARALHMLQSVGWIAAHRFLFADLRFHLLGWPAFLAPDGRTAALRPSAPPA
jgi:transposase-like protein